MTYDLKEQHIRNALNLKAPERYSYFVKRVADWEEAWGLRAESGWETVDDDDGVSYLPLWPHEKFAQLCANGLWEGSRPERISVTELLDGWLPDLLATGRRVAVFPLPDGNGVLVDPQRLSDDLLQERSLMED